MSASNAITVEFIGYPNWNSMTDSDKASIISKFFIKALNSIFNEKTIDFWYSGNCAIYEGFYTHIFKAY